MRGNTMKKSAIRVIIISHLLIVSCSTAPPKPVLSEPITHEIADLKIVLRFLDKETLVDRHGRNDARMYLNPYYGYPALITKIRLLAFELSAETTESEVEFSLDKISLEIDDVRGKAKSRAYLRNTWRIVSFSKTTLMDLLMKKTLLPDEFLVTPDTPVSGYLVFGENYPELGGEGLLKFKLTTPSGDGGQLEIPIYFSEDGSIKKDSADNTGIFGED